MKYISKKTVKNFFLKYLKKINKVKQNIFGVLNFHDNNVTLQKVVMINLYLKYEFLKMKYDVCREYIWKCSLEKVKNKNI